MPRKGQVTDHRGKQFGQLTFIARLRNDSSRAHVLCACSVKTIAAVRHLIDGRIVSCGCLKRERCKQMGLVRNPTQGGLFRTLYSVYRNRRHDSRVFKLTFEECAAFFQGNCYYCGSPPAQVYWTKGGTWKAFPYNGIDRVDNTLGYVPGNCVSCCKTCNYAKRVMTEQEFIAWVTRVYTHLSKKVSK